MNAIDLLALTAVDGSLCSLLVCKSARSSRRGWLQVVRSRLSIAAAEVPA